MSKSGKKKENSKECKKIERERQGKEGKTEGRQRKVRITKERETEEDNGEGVTKFRSNRELEVN